MAKRQSQISPKPKRGERLRPLRPLIDRPGMCAPYEAEASRITKDEVIASFSLLCERPERKEASRASFPGAEARARAMTKLQDSQHQLEIGRIH